MVGSAQRYRELVARLAAHRARLGEFQMRASAGLLRWTRLRSYEFKVGFVAEPPRFADREQALVDLAGNGACLERDRMWLIVRSDCVRGTAGGPDGSTTGLTFLGRPLSRLTISLDAGWGCGRIGLTGTDTGWSVVMDSTEGLRWAILAAKASSTSLASTTDRRFLDFRMAIARGCSSSSGRVSISWTSWAPHRRGLLGAELFPDRRVGTFPGWNWMMGLRRCRAGIGSKPGGDDLMCLPPPRWWHQAARRGRPRLPSPPS